MCYWLLAKVHPCLFLRRQSPAVVVEQRLRLCGCSQFNWTSLPFRTHVLITCYQCVPVGHASYDLYGLRGNPQTQCITVVPIWLCVHGVCILCGLSNALQSWPHGKCRQHKTTEHKQPYSNSCLRHMNVTNRLSAQFTAHYRTAVWTRPVIRQAQQSLERQLGCS